MGDQYLEQQIDGLNRRVVQMLSQANYSLALKHAEQACELARRAHGNDHPRTAISLSNLGMVLQAMGDLARARSCLEQALAINRHVLGDDHSNTGKSFSNLGSVLQAEGNLSAALACYRQDLGIQRRALGDNHPVTAQSFNNLGALLKLMGQMREARSCLERALAIRRRALGDEHLDTAGSLNNLGLLLQEMGNPAEARPYLERALAIFRRELGDDHPHTASSLTNLGMVLQAMGDLAGARPCLEEALAIRRRVLGDHHPDTAQSLNNLGGLLDCMGDLPGACSYFEQALEITCHVLGSDHPDTVSILSNVGGLLESMGELARAQRYHEQALEVRLRVLGDNHPDTATSFNNLGRVLHAAGNLAGARTHLKRALAIRRRVLGDDHPDTAQSLNNLAGLLDSMGDWAGAHPCLRQALKVRRRVFGDGHPDTAQAFNNLGACEAVMGRHHQALALMRKAAAADDGMIGQIFAMGSEQQRLLFLHRVRGNLAGFLSLVCCHLPNSAKAVRVALDLVLRRKALGSEALAAQRDAILGGRYKHLRPKLEQLTQLRRRTAEKMLAGPAPGEALAAHQQTIQQWLQEQREREAFLAGEIPEMKLDQQLQKADHRAIAFALPEGVALVEFVRIEILDYLAVRARGDPQWQPARYLAFVLPAKQPDQVQMIDLGEADPIDQMIGEFRAFITTQPGERPKRETKVWSEETESIVETHAPATVELPSVATQLRQVLFDPLVEALGSHTQLWLSLDGDLARLPFEVLPLADGRLLLDTYQISFVACGRDALRFGAAIPGQPSKSLVIANPDFDLGESRGRLPPPATSTASSLRERLRQYKSFDPLPNTRLEGERIAALLDAECWQGKAVLETPLKRRLRSPRILHLATHGFFLNDEPPDLNKGGHGAGLIGDWKQNFGPPLTNPLLRSCLTLAGVNTWVHEGKLPEEAEDGLLTAEDVTGMDLLNTEVVVLSACETGLGHVHVGEGVFGLRRAFAAAGAKTLVMSLWSVPDEQTQELMVDFYQRILRGEGRAEALRRAQQAIRSRYPHPYFWGAFICQGDPSPLLR